jgi:excisionase family DNA binding protein
MVLYVQEIAMADELLTVKEVAARLKLNPQTVRRWIRSGRLRGVRVGARGWRVREMEVPPVAGSLSDLTDEQVEQDRRAIEEALALRREFERKGVRISAAELVREARDKVTRSKLSAGTLPPPTPAQVEARMRAMDRLRSLRAAFNRPGPTLQEILDEERREQEED